MSKVKGTKTTNKTIKRTGHEQNPHQSTDNKFLSTETSKVLDLLALKLEGKKKRIR